MPKGDKSKKPKPTGSPPRTFTPEAQELRALLRRIPDGLKATLTALAARPQAERERVLTELTRGLGKEFLPLLRAAALGPQEEVAASSVRVLPLLATRAAADVLSEVYLAHSECPRGKLAQRAARALQAQGIRVDIPEGDAAVDPPRLTLRETWVSAPDGVGSRSAAARLQDQYGVWHAILVLWNDRAGVKDGFMRPFSRQEWDERAVRMDGRGSTQVVCPVDYARWQVTIARGLNQQTGLPLRDYVQAWDQYVGPPPEDYVPPDPTLLVRAAGEEERAAWSAESHLLFESGDVRRWFLEGGDCVPFVRRWAALRFGREVGKAADQEIRTQRLVAVYREAGTALLTGEVLELYRKRLLDLARTYAWKQETREARISAAAVCELEAGTTPLDIPFFIALLDRSFIATDEMLNRGEDPERSRYHPLRPYQY